MKFKSTTGAVFEEITLTVKGYVVVNGKTEPVVVKYKHRLDPHSFHMAMTRPVKRRMKKGGGYKFTPSEYVFHNINFITTSKQ